MRALFDVVAVDIETGAERLIASAQSERNADIIECMAVMRRGVETEFFKTVPHDPARIAAAPNTTAG